MSKLQQPANPIQKYVKNNEFVLYIAAVFLYTTMTGMVGNYRSAYLVNVLQLSDDSVALYNGLTSVLGFVLSFFYATIIDNHKIGKDGKFRPLIKWSAVPCGVLLVLSFVTPKGLTGTWLMIYLVTIALLLGAATSFGNVINTIAFVMSPDGKERDKVISFRSISSAIGNSAPLVVVLVLGLIFKDNEHTQYIAGASLCGAVGTVMMLFASRGVKERITYSAEKKNPVAGYADVLKNKYARFIIISEFLKSFRGVSTYMGVFMAAALLGSTSKFLFFGLPTGIGTAVGMLVINMLLKKFNSKQLYIASGIYSVIVNVAAFAVGYAYFNNPSFVLQIVFIAFLFLIGLQFGASNLLPSLFQADVLESIELETGKRLDAALPFVISIGTMVSGTIANTLAPKILYGDHSIIHYIQPTDLVPNPEQTLETKITMLFFYTVVHGIMMFLAGVPFFFYKLTGKTKEEIHNAVLAQRESMK